MVSSKVVIDAFDSVLHACFFVLKITIYWYVIMTSSERCSLKVFHLNNYKAFEIIFHNKLLMKCACCLSVKLCILVIPVITDITVLSIPFKQLISNV